MSDATNSRVYVALLRGINVGGRNKLPMATLRAIFEEQGCRSVRTYIQSGNVVFRASAQLASHIAALARRAIGERTGLTVPVVVRSLEELQTVARCNPYREAAEQDHRKVIVVFLADKPSAAQVAGLDPERSPPDRFQVHGADVYLHVPNGMARTRLTNAYFDTNLKTTSTARNWRTLLKLLAMAEGL